MLLAERHPDAAMMPLPGTPHHAAWLELMIYLANTVLPAMRDWFYAGKDGDGSGADAVSALARRRIEGAWDQLDQRLASGRSFLVGTHRTTAGLLAVMVMRWSRGMPRPATAWPALAAYIERMCATSGFVELCRREGLSG